MVQSVLSPGWRADSEELALELREEMKLTAGDRLDPDALAEYLGIPTLSLDSFAESVPEAVAQLRSDDERFSFSAATVPVDTGCVIVYHPDHPEPQRVETLAHELAHVLLEHEPAPLPLYDEKGDRISVSLREEWEADYLAGALLAPRCMVAAVLGRCGENLSCAAARFGVSSELMVRRQQASEDVDRWSGRELRVLLLMTEEEMVMTRQVVVRRGQLGDWTSVLAPSRQGGARRSSPLRRRAAPAGRRR